jgi:hypothetical protein
MTETVFTKFGMYIVAPKAISTAYSINSFGTHENPLLKKLLLREENRRLKRNRPIDLI